MSAAAERYSTGGLIYGGKIKLIQFAKRELQIADEDYRAILLRAGGVVSSKELTLQGFEAVMAEFHRLGFVRKPSPRKPKQAGGTAHGRPTTAQWRLLEDRARLVGYTGLDDSRFIAWVKPRGKVDHPRFLDGAGLQRVLAALGNWIKRDNKTKASAPCA